MDTSLKQTSPVLQPGAKFDLPAPPSFQEPFFRKPNDSEPTEITPETRTDPETETHTDPEIDPQTDLNSQGSITSEDDSPLGKLSTDLSSLLGDYGSIMFDILNQLFDVFGKGSNNMFDVANDIQNGNNGSSNPFLNFISTIDAIVRKLDGSDSQRLNNVVNAYSSVMGYYFSLISANMQNQFNVQQWMIESEYNSPKEQLKRFADAGLNPLHFFNNASNQSGSISASNIGSPTMHPSSGQSKEEEKNMKAQRVMQGLNSVSQNVQQGFQNYQQASELSIDRQRLANETAKTRQDISESEARRINTEVTTEGLAQSNAYDAERYPLELKELANTLLLQSKDGQIKDEQIKQLHEGVKLLIQDFKFKEGLNDITLHIKKKEYDQACETLKSIRTATDYQKWSYDFEKATGIPFNTPIVEKFAVLMANGQISKEAGLRFLLNLQAGHVLTGNMNPINAGVSVVTELLNAIDITNGLNGSSAPASSLSDWSKSLIPFERSAKSVIKALNQNPSINDVNSGNPYGVDPVSIGY